MGYARTAMGLVLGGAVLLLGCAGAAHAEDPWLERFDRFCAQTGDVMTLSPAELQTLLDQCESFRQQIDALPESPRKVQRKRLALTCNLVRFALEQKNSLPQEK